MILIIFQFTCHKDRCNILQQITSTSIAYLKLHISVCDSKKIYKSTEKNVPNFENYVLQKYPKVVNCLNIKREFERVKKDANEGLNIRKNI